MRKLFFTLFLGLNLAGFAQQECSWTSFQSDIDSAYYFEDRFQYLQAIHYYERGLNCIAELYETRESYVYTLRLTFMGYSLYSSGQYNRAIDSLKSSIDLYRAIGSQASSDCAYAWLLLGKTYFIADALYQNSAIKALDSAAVIYKKEFGESSKQMVWVLRALGEGYFFTDKEKSLSYYLEAKEMMISMRYWNKSLYAVNEQDIATVMMAMGNISEEHLDVYRKELARISLTKEPDEYHTLCANLTEVYLKQDKPDSLYKYLERYQKAHQRLLSLAKVYSYEAYLEYKKKLDGKQKYGFSALYQTKEKAGRFSSLAYAHALFEKSSLLSSQLSEIELYPSHVVNKYRRLKELRKLNAINSPKGTFRSDYDLDSLRSEIASLEISLSINMLEASSGQTYSWKDVESKLEEGEVCIEFIYGRLSIDSVRYGALVGKKGWEHPLYIDLCSEKELIAASQEEGSIITASVNRGVNIDQLEGLIDNQSFYNLIWAPIAKELEIGNTLYISPVGRLNHIAFAALENENHEPLIMNYKLRTVLSTKNIHRGHESKLKFYLMGGIDYDSRKELTMSDRLKDRVVNWQALVGTLREVEGIHAMAKKQKYSSIVLSEMSATEEAFNTLTSSTKTGESVVLHIATHGYSFVHPYDKEYGKPRTHNTLLEHVMEPMIRTGLIMAGANEAWSGQYSDDYEDGILMAYEIADLDLRAVELAVLSACETATGDVNDTEGVFGLQRAFKMAGVKYIISSLWPVPDESTAEFMLNFYGHLFEGMSVEDAFVATQREMSLKYSDPIDWAAWVLVS